MHLVPDGLPLVFDFTARRGPVARHASVRKPKLFVWGTRDQYAAKDAALKRYGTLAPPKDVVLFEGLDLEAGPRVPHGVARGGAERRVVAWVLKAA